MKEVSSTTLHVASLTESFENFDLSSGEDLHVEWTAISEKDVRIRASGLRRKLYYRMDAVQRSGVTSFAWPTNILSALNITKKDIGLVSWTQYAVGETVRNVYVPLRISQHKKPIRQESYQMVLVPGRELTEVFISLAAVDRNSHSLTFYRQDEALGYGYYPAERGVKISITNLGRPGIYYMEIGATFRCGGVATKEIWFYHVGI